MKTMLRLFFVAAAGFAAFQVGAQAAVKPGDVAPDFTATDIAGRAQSLARYKGNIVVLEWTNPECPFVRKHYESGNIPKLQRDATSEGVVWLAINSGRDGAQGDYNDAAAARWLKGKSAAPTAYIRDRDGKIGRLYGAKSTPHLFVINSEGVVAYAGAIDSIRSSEIEDIAKATNYVRVALDDLKAGRPIEKRSTQPYGCSVHY